MFRFVFPNHHPDLIRCYSDGRTVCEPGKRTHDAKDSNPLEFALVDRPHDSPEAVFRSDDPPHFNLQHYHPPPSDSGGGVARARDATPESGRAARARVRRLTNQEKYRDYIKCVLYSVFKQKA